MYVCMYVYVHECIIEINEKTPDEGSSQNTLRIMSKIDDSLLCNKYICINNMCVYRIGTFSELRQRSTHQRFNSRVFCQP